MTLLGHAATPDKEGFVYLVMELCPGGHLFHEVERRKKASEPPFAERETAGVVHDVSAGLAHMHGSWRSAQPRRSLHSAPCARPEAPAA